ncbi:salicylate hydroxylase, putative [Paecilomyces variotii No. 5]|uniref:Salicylate hydroxylase, putative n=1 Tax=Byssochlamys spectabilis (strain No. 5 / NBRC 109023) TaxID=1356009 RepID=V5G772_BYSSN|nr:salicylate hydroxylase, putative [Paecilomyces variotii No. 5]
MPEVKKVSVLCSDHNLESETNALSKAIIIGAGPAGVAAAIRLTKHNNISCTVYELRPVPTTLGGAVGIPSNGLRLFDRLGLYKALSTKGSESSNVRIHFAQGGGLVEADAVPKEAREKTGHSYMRIKRVELMDVLLTAASEMNIPIHYGKKMVDITEDEDTKSITVTFSDGTSDTADLLLGCDGIHSAVRTQYVDPSCQPQYSGVSGTCVMFPTSAISAESFESLQAINVSFTTEGAIALVPCTATGDEIFFVFSRKVPIPESGDTRDGWEEHRKKEVDSFKNLLLDGALKSVRGQWGEVLTQAVKSTSSVSFYPIFRLPLGGKWFRGSRCLLMGDAAHAMQPHAGQGVSMAMEDVFLLSRLLKDRESSLTEVFEKFNRVRRPRINKIYEIAAHNGERRIQTSPWALWAREWAMWAGILAMRVVGKQQTLISDPEDLLYDIDAVDI